MGYKTPIVPCYRMEPNNEIYIKRDDLIPYSFGGNKVRIADEFFSDMKDQGKNCMVGYGSARSNLCRALANMSYSKLGDGYCHIISPLEDDGSRIHTNNSLIVKSSGAIVHECQKTNVSETVSKVMSDCKQAGLKPYYIYGDSNGKGNEAVPVRAYAKVYEEIKGEFDYIFLATGTGMTQAGLLAGKKINKGNEKIVGISISRDSGKESAIIQDYLKAYYKSENILYDGRDEITVIDDYLESGYGKYSEEVLDTIRSMFLINGIPMDTTYTGKAFHGMLKYIKRENIKGKRILFLHTGGTPLFFDKIDEIFRQDCAFNQLYEFIKEIDNELPTPLSGRVNLKEYAEKLYSKAHLCYIKDKDRIVALVAGYIKNTPDNIAYVTLVGTLPEFRGVGYAEKLMRQFISDSLNQKLSGVHLHTDKSNIAAESLYHKLGFKEYVVDQESRPDDYHLVLWLKQ